MAIPQISAGADASRKGGSGQGESAGAGDLHEACGAAVTDEGVRFRVWAAAAQRVAVVLEWPMRGEHDLDAVRDGYFSGFVQGVAAGARYRFRLDGDGPFPDPCSRFQPEDRTGHRSWSIRGISRGRRRVARHRHARSGALRVACRRLYP